MNQSPPHCSLGDFWGARGNPSSRNALPSMGLSRGVSEHRGHPSLPRETHPISPRLSPTAPRWHITALWHVPPCPPCVPSTWTHPLCPGPPTLHQARQEGHDGTLGLTPLLWAGAHCHKATMSPKPPPPQHRGAILCPALSCGGSLKLKINEYEWGGGDTPRWDSQCGDSQPLSALLLPLLQQLDDLGDALLGDLPGTEGCQPQGTP